MSAWYRPHNRSATLFFKFIAKTNPVDQITAKKNHCRCKNLHSEEEEAYHVIFWPRATESHFFGQNSAHFERKTRHLKLGSKFKL